jgi:hypothetical protein
VNLKICGSKNEESCGFEYMHMSVCWKSLKEKNDLGKLGVDGTKYILKWM